MAGIPSEKVIARLQEHLAKLHLELAIMETRAITAEEERDQLAARSTTEREQNG